MQAAGTEASPAEHVTFNVTPTSCTVVLDESRLRTYSSALDTPLETRERECQMALRP